MSSSGHRLNRWRVGGTIVLAIAVGTACAPVESGLQFPDELGAGGRLGGKAGKAGKADAVSVSTIADAVYSETSVWQVFNQWEDTATEAARESGLAWGPNSGLNWDEKYALWVESLPEVDQFSGGGSTFDLITPWGEKSLPAPKADCADVSLMMRASFAAWHNLPFIVAASDGSTPVYLGHFGIRTPSGKWTGMPNFATAYPDHSDMDPAEYLAAWPTDDALRSQGVQPGDDQPFLGPSARTGTYLDEIHLNKRAARFIRLLLVYTGSIHLADSRNTYNLNPAAIRAGDTMLWRWQASGVGHTMVTVRVDRTVPEVLEVQTAFGNLPPDQPAWKDPIVTKFYYTDPRAGGSTDSTDYAPLNGGLKRWRVAKVVGGVWRNTFMNGDDDSWVNDSDLDAIRERPDQIGALFGQATPTERRDALLGIIESKRRHLKDAPSSCAARTAREKAFSALYAVMEENFGMTQLDVDGAYRVVQDYVFGELVYDQARTCCWNSTNNRMYKTIMELDVYTRAESETCTAPEVFKGQAGGYDRYPDHNPDGWVDWSADEACPWGPDLEDDVEAPRQASAFCDVLPLWPPPPAPSDTALPYPGGTGIMSSPRW